MLSIRLNDLNDQDTPANCLWFLCWASNVIAVTFALLKGFPAGSLPQFSSANKITRNSSIRLCHSTQYVSAFVVFVDTEPSISMLNSRP